MTLSLDDVRNKRFRMARKGGYEVLEVDEFVDEVEESFAQLLEENTSLRKQVDALKSSSGEPTSEQTPEPTSAQTAEQPAALAPAEPAQPTPPADQPEAREPERIVVTTSAEASTAVVRLVQLSTEQAESLVREANEDATRIREEADRNATKTTEDARTHAERVESDARAQADRVQSDAQRRSEELDADLSRRRTELFGDLDKQRDSLTETVSRLRDFEQRYRSNLDQHLRGQLDSLKNVGLEPEGGPDRTASASAPAAHASEPQHSDGEGSSTGASGTSDTPRLDALLGDQR